MLALWTLYNSYETTNDVSEQYWDFVLHNIWNYSSWYYILSEIGLLKVDSHFLGLPMFWTWEYINHSILFYLFANITPHFCTEFLLYCMWTGITRTNIIPITIYIPKCSLNAKHFNVVPIFIPLPLPKVAAIVFNWVVGLGYAVKWPLRDMYPASLYVTSPYEISWKRGLGYNQGNTPIPCHFSVELQIHIGVSGKQGCGDMLLCLDDRTARCNALQ